MKSFKTLGMFICILFAVTATVAPTYSSTLNTMPNGQVEYDAVNDPLQVIDMLSPDYQHIGELDVEFKNAKETLENIKNNHTDDAPYMSPEEMIGVGEALKRLGDALQQGLNDGVVHPGDQGLIDALADRGRQFGDVAVQSMIEALHDGYGSINEAYRTFDISQFIPQIQIQIPDNAKYGVGLAAAIGLAAGFMSKQAGVGIGTAGLAGIFLGIPADVGGSAAQAGTGAEGTGASVAGTTSSGGSTSGGGSSSGGGGWFTITGNDTDGWTYNSSTTNGEVTDSWKDGDTYYFEVDTDDDGEGDTTETSDNVQIEEGGMTVRECDDATEDCGGGTDDNGSGITADHEGNLGRGRWQSFFESFTEMVSTEDFFMQEELKGNELYFFGIDVNYNTHAYRYDSNLDQLVPLGPIGTFIMLNTVFANSVHLDGFLRSLY